MARYISATDFQEHIELEDLNNTDDPKLRVVERWIKSSEAEVDDLTSNRWDLHIVDDELITPDAQIQDFLLKQRPLKRVVSLEYQNGTQWSPDWTAIDEDDYRLVNKSISKIRTKDYYFGEEKLRVTYEAGYEIIPQCLIELTLLLVEKRYIMSRLGIAAADSETVSVAVILIQDKGNASLNYRVEGLQKEIDDNLKLLGKKMKSRNYNMGYLTTVEAPNKRYRY